MGIKTELLVPKLCFEHVPVPCFPLHVDYRPIDESDRVAKDPENRVLVPVHAGIIPHAVEVGDVVCEGGGRWRKNILGSEHDGVAIAKQQCLCLVTCHSKIHLTVYFEYNSVNSGLFHTFVVSF